jgi:hypothetical protein
MGKWLAMLEPETPVESLPTELPKVSKVTYHGFTLAELESEAHPDEWMEVKDYPPALELIQEGIRPERWTGTATCAQCGKVPVPPFADGLTMADCRWCDHVDRTW